MSLQLRAFQTVVRNDQFTYEFRPRVSPIFSKAAAMSDVRFLKTSAFSSPLQQRSSRLTRCCVNSSPGAARSRRSGRRQL